MPCSIATMMALRFVKNSDLKTRIKALETSYKLQGSFLFGLGYLNLFGNSGLDNSVITENYLLTG